MINSLILIVLNIDILILIFIINRQINNINDILKNNNIFIAKLDLIIETINKKYNKRSD